MATPPTKPEILIVEDSPVEAELLRRCLVRAGYPVTAASNGAEGLAAVRARRPALVLSDIRMPQMDGYQLCQAIKQDDELWGTPMILLSVLSEARDIIEAINVGADGYIIKPYVESVLLERIRCLLAVPAIRKGRSEPLEVEYAGQRHTISADGQQMLNLLFSVYENTLSQNRELMSIQSQLSLLNQSLDQKVCERTAELEHSNRALRTLSACNVALVHARTEEELFENTCRNIVEIGGYPLAWVEYPQTGGKPILGAHFGDEKMLQAHAELAERPEHDEHCLAAIALRERRTLVCSECEFQSLREAGVNAALALPLLHNAEIYGVLTIFSTEAEADAFGPGEIKLSEELAGDLAFGIVTLRTRAERDKSTNKLRGALEGTISAIARTLEKRDPYTAGHQQRVAELSLAIGREMALNEERLDGLYLGAMIHDIGKIAVPAEILSKPGKLSKPEFELIHAHPTVGAEILKDIEFPWPIAMMIQQHHERLDGNGYPDSSKDDEIILNARIIGVADVVEAMTSHRPYRPALGIDAALAEIEQGSGIRYDPVVVDACVRLFREKGYSFIAR